MHDFLLCDVDIHTSSITSFNRPPRSAIILNNFKLPSVLARVTGFHPVCTATKLDYPRSHVTDHACIPSLQDGYWHLYE